MQLTITVTPDNWERVSALMDQMLYPEASSQPIADQPITVPEATPAPPEPAKEYRAASGEAFEETDVEGVRWDKRIHSAGGAKNQDGSWRKKRGVDPALVQQVEAEQADAEPAPAPAPAPAPPTPPTPEPAPAAAAEPAPAATAAGEPQVTFQAFSKRVGGMLTNHGLTMPAVNETLNSYGIPSFPEARNQESMLGVVLADLESKVQ